MRFIERFIAVVVLVLAMLAVGHTDEPVPVQAQVFEDRVIPPLEQIAEVKKIKPINRAQVKCLADNIYYEAGNQPWDGKMGVAFVTMNRLADPDYPDSICGVVYQRHHPKYCQFSWVCENPTRFVRRQWQESMFIAQLVIEHFKQGGILKDPTDGAQFFHATYVEPKWRTSLKQTIQIADHIFYRKIQAPIQQ